MKTPLRLAHTTSAALLGATLAPWTLAQTAAQPAQLPAPAPAAPAAPPGPAAPAASASEPGPEAVLSSRELPKEVADIEAELAHFTAPGALTADEAARRSIEHSARVEAKREGVRSVEAQRDATLARFYPKLTGTARYTRLSEVTMPTFGATPDGVMPVYATQTQAGPVTGPLVAVASPGYSFPVILNQWELKGTLSLPVSDWVFRLSSAISGANSLRDSALANERAEELIIQTDARVAYYNWIKALGATYVADKSLKQMESALEDTRRAFALGTASKADVLRLESGLQRVQLMAVRAKNMVEVTEQQLRVLMNDPSGTRYKVGEPMLEDVDMPGIPSFDEAIKEAHDKRMELQALRNLEDSYEDGAFLSKVDGLPRLDAQGNLGTWNPNQRIFPQSDTFTPGWDVSLMLTWTPTDIPGALANSGANTAKAAETRAQRRALEDALRVEVTAAIYEAETAKTAVLTAQEVLKSAEEGYRVRRELFKVGRATTLEVNDAETSLAQARLDLVFSKMDAKIARVKLLHVLGRDTDSPRPKSAE